MNSQSNGLVIESNGKSCKKSRTVTYIVLKQNIDSGTLDNKQWRNQWMN